MDAVSCSKLRRLLARDTQFVLRARTRRGVGILEFAALVGSAQCVAPLLEAGADADSRACIVAARAAARRGSISCLRALLARRPNLLDVASRSGNDSPLFDAVAARQASAVEFLLEMRVSPHVADSFGRLPLHIAAQRGAAECSQLLLRAGAAPEARDAQANTPLLLCAECAHASARDVAALLLVAGAFVGRRSAAGLSPLMRSAEMRSIGLLKFSPRARRRPERAMRTAHNRAASCGARQCSCSARRRRRRRGRVRCVRRHASSPRDR